MTAFKYKPNKIKYLDEINTLDSTHKAFAKRFNTGREDIEDKKQQKIKLTEELENLDDDGEFDISVIKKMNKLKKEIKALDDQINDIENNISEINYYSNAGDFIIEYYNEEHNDIQSLDVNEIKEKQVIEEEECQLDKLNDISKINRKPKKNTKKRARNVITNQKSILDFFDEDNNATKDKINKTKKKKEKEDTNTNGQVKNKATLYDQYMKIIDPSYNTSNKTKQIAYCKTCNVDKLLLQSDGIFVCTKCGEFENVIIESDIPNYKDQLQEKPAYIIRMRRTGRCGIVRFLIIMN